MAQMTQQRAIALIQAENRGVSLGDATIYADAFLAYQTAQANILEHGEIVAHPRTGAPIDNPYCATRARAAKAMQSCSKVKRTDMLWHEAAQ